jgi:hypothetical protein
VMATIMPGLIPPASMTQYAFKCKRHLSLSLSLSLYYTIKQYAFTAEGSLVSDSYLRGTVSDSYLRGTVSAYPSHRFTVVQSPLFNRQIQTHTRQKIIETDATHRNHSARRIRERERETEGGREEWRGVGEPDARVPLRLLEHFVERRVRTDVENIASLFAMVQT